MEVEVSNAPGMQGCESKMRINVLHLKCKRTAINVSAHSLPSSQDMRILIPVKALSQSK
jgi:hypothetical protein